MGLVDNPMVHPIFCALGHTFCVWVFYPGKVPVARIGRVQTGGGVWGGDSVDIGDTGGVSCQGSFHWGRNLTKWETHLVKFQFGHLCRIT
jgi:hypothetical protein